MIGAECRSPPAGMSGWCMCSATANVLAARSRSPSCGNTGYFRPAVIASVISGSCPHRFGMPNLCGQEPLITEAITAGRKYPVFPHDGDLERAASTFAVALHMHQPLIPAGGDLHSAPIISNLAWMMDHQDIGDNHNAPVFVWCYKRMGEFIRQLLGEGRQPRMMLDYSGTLLHGMRQMGLGEVFDALGYLTHDGRARQTTEWLGSTWGH